MDSRTRTVRVAAPVTGKEILGNTGTETRSKVV
jgi:hypothetical protein